MIEYIPHAKILQTSKSSSINCTHILKLSDALSNMFFQKWFIYTKGFVTLKLLIAFWNKIQFIFLQ